MNEIQLGKPFYVSYQEHRDLINKNSIKRGISLLTDDYLACPYEDNCRQTERTLLPIKEEAKGKPVVVTKDDIFCIYPIDGKCNVAIQVFAVNEIEKNKNNLNKAIENIISRKPDWVEQVKIN